MSVFIVVHHRDDPHPNWSNEWDGDVLLKAITTPRQVADRLELARERGERVYVHRCAYGGQSAMICCSCAVGSVDTLSKTQALIRFIDVREETAKPPVQSRAGLNMYEAALP